MLKRIPLNIMFSAAGPVPPQRRASVVSRVLNEFRTLPVAARNALRTAVNDEVTPTTGGFRRGQAGRALDRSSFLLQEPVTQAVDASEVLATAVLKCWAESHPSLREAVERHLTGRGLTTPGPNLPERQFRGYWPVHQWEVEQGAFAQTYDEDFDPEDVALMLCYVSGNFPVVPEPDGVAPDDEGALLTALSAALAALRELPATSWEWERQIPDFVASVSRLIEEKAAQLQWTQEFDAILASIREEQSELLRFFEQDTLQWSAARVSPNADIPATLRLAEKLRSQLAEYRPIHETAPGISEERERIQQRAARQPLVLETLQAIDSLMTGEAPEPPLAPPPAPPPPKPGSASQEEKAPAIVAQQPAGPELSPAFERQSPQATLLREPAPSQVKASDAPSTPEPPAPGVDPSEYTALQSEYSGLRDKATALGSENQDLKDEVEALKAELFSSQEREDSWRLAYRTAVDGSLEETGVPSPVVESVHDAVEMAKNRFRQELVLAPNSESNIEDNPFTDPSKVWEALHWLATTYYSSKMGRLRVTDFDQSIKEACGWWYKGDQGETTVSRYRESYSTRVDGKRYTLVEHIGKGTTFDARYTIRIAFDWDRDRRQVVIGYIGRHQQTDAS